MLLIQTSNELYAIDARKVVEVLPLLQWRRLPHAPEGIVGVINYHGKTVPLVDLTELVSQRSSERRMSTRIVVVEYGNDAGEMRWLGVVTEQVLETLRIDEKSLGSAGISTPGAPYLGHIAVGDKGLIQTLDLLRIFPPAIRKQLFAVLEDYDGGSR